jgi:hypothetical protein
MDLYSKYLAIAGTLRHRECTIELVSTLTLPDGTTTEVSHSRRAVCRRTRRKGNVTELEFIDLDRAALEQTFPFETFTVADFPELYVEHVNWRVPQGVGTVRKVPLAWISKTGGAYAYRYAGPKVIGTPGTVLTVYRGTQAGQGSIVNPAEYGVSTAWGVSGVQVVTVDFDREQVDFNGRPYVIEADFSLPGNRAASAEVARILTAYGRTVGPSFAAAIAADTGTFLVDALYGGGDNERTGDAILQDLLQVARGWLFQTSSGAWDISQDVAKVATAAFNTESNLIYVEEFAEEDTPKAVSIEYFPTVSGDESRLTGQLSRVCNGVADEKRLKNRYVSDHVVADRLVCYWQKRLNTWRSAKATVHAVQLVNGERISITNTVHWSGMKDFIATGIARPADRNDLSLREYVADVYVYTAGTLPGDATNGYRPDYSFTPPSAPTSLAVISQATSTDVDGKVTAYALIRATPPAVNWQRVMIQVKDLTTGEIRQGQLRLESGNYETVVAGLRPNRNHEVKAFAVNANGLEGAESVAVAFTSSTSTAVPAAPSIVLVGQTHSFQLNIAWARVAPPAGEPPIDTYVVEYRVGAGAYSETFRGDAQQCVVTPLGHGPVYQAQVYALNRYGTAGPPATSGTITLTPVIGTNHIAPGGVGTGNLANGAVTNPILGAGSISQGKVNWAYTINNYVGLAAGATVGIGTLGVALVPTVRLTGGGSATGLTIVGGPTTGTPLGARNDTAGALNVRVDEPVIVP